MVQMLQRPMSKSIAATRDRVLKSMAQILGVGLTAARNWIRMEPRFTIAMFAIDLTWTLAKATGTFVVATLATHGTLLASCASPMSQWLESTAQIVGYLASITRCRNVPSFVVATLAMLMTTRRTCSRACPSLLLRQTMAQNDRG